MLLIFMCAPANGWSVTKIYVFMASLNQLFGKWKMKVKLGYVGGLSNRRI